MPLGRKGQQPLVARIQLGKQTRPANHIQLLAEIFGNQTLGAVFLTALDAADAPVDMAVMDLDKQIIAFRVAELFLKENHRGRGHQCPQPVTGAQAAVGIMAGEGAIQYQHVRPFDSRPGKGSAFLKHRIQQRAPQTGGQIIQDHRQAFLQAMVRHHLAHQGLHLARLIPGMQRDLAKQRVLHHRKARHIAACVQRNKQPLGPGCQRAAAGGADFQNAGLEGCGKSRADLFRRKQKRQRHQRRA